MNVLSRHNIHSVLDARPDVGFLKFGIVILYNLAKRDTIPHQFKYALHRNTRACHTGLSKMNIRINCYTLFHDRPPLNSVNSWRLHSYECIFPSHILPQDERVHLVGAFIGDDRLKVRHMAHDRVHTQNAVATQDLPSRTRHF